MNLSPRQFVRKAPRALRRRIRHQAARVMDRVSGTHAALPDEGEIRRILPNTAALVPDSQVAPLAGITANYVNGRFEFLGSGWLPWTYGTSPPGREGHRFDPGPVIKADLEGLWLEHQVTAKNLPTARKLWQMVEHPYAPIDWQLDARSGARWSAATHSLDTSIGLRKGADVKVPWELGKLQHLPRLALAHGLAIQGRRGFMMASEYRRAYQNQLCDFLALNPPRYGCNWATAMLSGIRIANILVAHDLFKASGATFDAAFERTVLQATHEHIDHIFNHLDWWDLDRRNNHYLANIAGLAFAAAYLPASDRAASILAFCRRELETELDWQFNGDGSHFEGSTAYHAFSAEMLAWTAAILGAVGAPLDPPKPQVIPSEARKRAFSKPANGDAQSQPRGAGRGIPSAAFQPIKKFLTRMVRPDGQLLQIGDNDSGRFLKLDVLAGCTQLATIRRRFLNLRELAQDQQPYWNERYLDYSPTLALLSVVGQAAAGIPTENGSAPNTVAGAVAATLLERWKPETTGRSKNYSAAVWTPVAGGVATETARLAAMPRVRSCSQRFPDCGEEDSSNGLRSGLTFDWFEDFGICLFRSERLWLAIRAGGTLRSDGGHFHADALSFELHIDGVAYRVDPGAYVYTSLPWRRRQFRSESAHGIPRLRGQTEFEDSRSTFSPARDSGSEVIALDDRGLVGKRTTPAGDVYRSFVVTDSAVEVVDYSTDGQPIHLEPLPWWSPGYGQLAAFDPGCVTINQESGAAAREADLKPDGPRSGRPAIRGTRTPSGSRTLRS
ncbi:MAG: hypothetical protein HKN29_04060 [Rhodothermales bacterium]|nr:hypothetical protein [Rhodothermales bacterium]